MKTTTKWFFGFLTAIILTLLACSAVAQVTIRLRGSIPSSWMPLPPGTMVQVECSPSPFPLTVGSIWKSKQTPVQYVTVLLYTNDTANVLRDTGETATIPGAFEFLGACYEKVAPVNHN